MAAAQGATNVAFLFAGLVYVMVGLAYTELAAAFQWLEVANFMYCAAWVISGVL